MAWNRYSVVVSVVAITYTTGVYRLGFKFLMRSNISVVCPPEPKTTRVFKGEVLVLMTIEPRWIERRTQRARRTNIATTNSNTAATWKGVLLVACIIMLCLLDGTE